MTIEELKKYNIFKEELLSLEMLKNQGFNNISYLLSTTENSYVIRVFKSNESVNISREFEYQIQKKAYKNNLASKPIFLNERFNEDITKEHDLFIVNKEALKAIANDLRNDMFVYLTKLNSFANLLKLLATKNYEE